MNATHSMAELPSWLSIARLDDRRYQLTDISVASIGYCLGIFPCREAAESIAAKIAQSRSQSRSFKSSNFPSHAAKTNVTRVPKSGNAGTHTVSSAL